MSGLSPSFPQKAANADATDAAYLSRVVSLGAEVNNDKIWIFLMFNELAEPSQVRGVLRTI